MYIDELKHRNAIICQPDDSIQKAAQTMRNYHIGDVIVLKDKDNKHSPIGMFADRKIVAGLLANKVNFNDVTVKYIINNELITFKDDDFLIEAITQMKDKGILSVPIVNQEAGLEGILLEGIQTDDDTIELITDMLSDLVRRFKHKYNHEIKIH